jgi:hypothetical protein
MNPVDEYLMAKEGGFWSAFKAPFHPENVGRTTGNAIVGLGTAAVAAAAVPAARGIMNAITKRYDYNAMMQHNPDLREEKSRNPALFNQAYTSLRKANPAFGRDPIISGGLMRKMMMDPLSPSGVLMEAMSAGRGSDQAFGQMTRQGLTSATKPMIESKPFDPFKEQKRQSE